MDSSTALPVLLHTDTMIIVSIPPGDGTGHSLSVVIDNRPSNSINFSYTAPIVTSIFPFHGPTDGGSIVRITGSNFGSE